MSNYDIERHFEFIGLPRLMLECLKDGRLWRCTVDSAAEAVEAERAAGSSYQALYCLPQRVTGYYAPEWEPASRTAIPTERIAQVGITYIDVDCIKSDKASMATDAESRQAQSVAQELFHRLAEAADSSEGLAFLFSGNGAQIWIRHQLIPANQALAPRNRLGAVLQHSYPQVDKVCGNIRRIGPLAGTWKRKGVATADRPYRQTHILVPSIGCEGVMSREIFESLANYFPQPPTTPTRTISLPKPKPIQTFADDIFKSANSLDLDQISSLCGGPSGPWCPRCVQVTDQKRGKSKHGYQIYICHHQTCVDQRPEREINSSLPTTWDVLRIVRYTQQLKNSLQAYDWLAGQGLVPPRKPPQEFDLKSQEIFNKPYNELNSTLQYYIRKQVQC